MAACSDGKHRQSAPGQRVLSWRFESSKYGGQIWKVLLAAVLLNECLSRGLVCRNADMGVNNLKIPKRLNRELRFESICDEIRLGFFFRLVFFFFHFILFVCIFNTGLAGLWR